MNKSTIFALVMLLAACGGTSSSGTSNDESEVKAKQSYQLRYSCSCESGPCADDFKQLSVFYWESTPNRLHLKTFFDFKKLSGEDGGEYPEGQVDLEGAFDASESTKTESTFADLASFDALTKKPLAAPPKAAKFVGGSARIDRSMLTRHRTAIMEGVPPKGSPEYIEGSLTVEAGSDKLAYHCVISSRYIE